MCAAKPKLPVIVEALLASSLCSSAWTERHSPKVDAGGSNPSREAENQVTKLPREKVACKGSYSTKTRRIFKAF